MEINIEIINIVISLITLVLITTTLILTIVNRRISPGILPDKIIAKLGREGMITPFHLNQVQPASYDLRLDSTKKNVLAPGESTLGITKERIALPNNIAAVVFGKSSVGRDFLGIHYAGFIDPGFRGQIVLEFTNNSDKSISFDKYNYICQIVFFRMSRSAKQGYSGHYQGQNKIRGNWKDE